MPRTKKNVKRVRAANEANLRAQAERRLQESAVSDQNKSLDKKARYTRKDLCCVAALANHGADVPSDLQSLPRFLLSFLERGLPLSLFPVLVTIKFDPAREFFLRCLVDGPDASEPRPAEHAKSRKLAVPIRQKPCGRAPLNTDGEPASWDAKKGAWRGIQKLDVTFVTFCLERTRTRFDKDGPEVQFWSKYYGEGTQHNGTTWPQAAMQLWSKTSYQALLHQLDVKLGELAAKGGRTPRKLCLEISALVEAADEGTDYRWDWLVRALLYAAGVHTAVFSREEVAPKLKNFAHFNFADVLRLFNKSPPLLIGVHVCHCATFEAELNTAVMLQFLNGESGWDYIWRVQKELIKLRDELAAESGLVVPPWCVFLEYKRRLVLVT